VRDDDGSCAPSTVAKSVSRTLVAKLCASMEIAPLSVENGEAVAAIKQHMELMLLGQALFVRVV
jgi:hypothetical protein